jgi:hypothetical protein
MDWPKDNGDDDPYIQILRRLTPQDRLRAGLALYQLARRLKRAGFKMQNPALSEDELTRLVNEAFLYASD